MNSDIIGQGNNNLGWTFVLFFQWSNKTGKMFQRSPCFIDSDITGQLKNNLRGTVVISFAKVQ